MHGLTQRAVIESMDQDSLEDTVWAAADALLSIWPQLDLYAGAQTTAALRANTDILSAGPGWQGLWQPDAHPLLFRAGQSLNATGLYTLANQTTGKA